MNIKERAKEYREKNGQVTNKDLLFYIIARLDDLEETNSKQNQRITKLETQIKIFWLLLPIIVSAALYLL